MSAQRVNRGSLFAFLVLFAFISSCGSAAVLSDTTFTPADGAVDQTVDVGVMVVFGRAVSDMGPWDNYFNLFEDGTVENLCTGYLFSNDGRSLQCYHDDLEPSTSYTMTVTHPQAKGGESLFSTEASN